MGFREEVADLATRLGVEDKSIRALATSAYSTRSGSLGSSATPLNGVDLSHYRDISITALATAITNMSTGATGTVVHSSPLTIAIRDNNTARAINWGSLFMAGPASLLTTTVAGKTHVNVFRFDSAYGMYVCLASDASGY